MRLTHTLKSPTATQYEMRYITAEATDQDIPEELRKILTQAEQWRVLQYLVLYQCTMNGILTGQLALDVSKAFLTNLSNLLLGGGLYDKIKPYGLV